MPAKESVMLRYVGGGSDKGYQVIIEPQGEGWIVRRGKLKSTPARPIPDPLETSGMRFVPGTRR